MKILVIQSSPHKNGSSNMLANQFIAGAKENGHEITVYDAAHSNLKPCLGCGACGMNGKCVQKDDMENLKALIRQSALIAFVTPLYYFGMSAQLKIVFDRFYSFGGELREKAIKTVLIASAYNPDPAVFTSLIAHYKQNCGYLHFDDKGMILGAACGTPEMTQNSEYMKRAFDLGKSV